MYSTSDSIQTGQKMNMSCEEDLLFSLRTNTNTIRRIDEQITNILMCANHTSLVVFDESQDTWCHHNVQGPCFLYERKTHPFYGLCIINRNDSKDHIELITADMEISKSGQYITYHNCLNYAWGIWFYDVDHANSMFEVLKKAIKKLKIVDSKIKAQLNPCEKKLKNVSSNIDIKNLRPHSSLGLRLNVNHQNGLSSNDQYQPESVREFFAKAQKPEIKSPLPNMFPSLSHIEDAQKSNILNRTLVPDDIDNSLDEASMLNDSVGDTSLCSNSSTDTLTESLNNTTVLLTPSDLVTPFDEDEKCENSVIEDNSKEKYILNKDEMIQAMQYLLKNDHQFTNKLYDAYLQSKEENQ